MSEANKHYAVPMKVKLASGKVKKVTLLVSASNSKKAEKKAMELIIELGSLALKATYGGYWARVRPLLT